MTSAPMPTKKCIICDEALPEAQWQTHVQACVDRMEGRGAEEEEEERGGGGEGRSDGFHSRGRNGGRSRRAEGKSKGGMAEAYT